MALRSYMTVDWLERALSYVRRAGGMSGAQSAHVDVRERLLSWVEIVTRPVADYGPANDEVCRVDARDLYHLLQAAEAFSRDTESG